MSILEQLNCRCDTLAKAAVARGIAQPTDDTSRSRQRLPYETASVYYSDSKITGDCGSELRFHLGRVKAREFYLGELGWYAATFDAVDWEARDRATSKKPEMFRQWLCKQCSGFCATGKNMGRWFGSDATCCPNCLAEDEDHTHLMHCADPGRFALFREGVKALSEWMAKGHTHPDLEKWLPPYLLNRGRRRFSALVGLPPSLRQLAASQDLIGWDCFLEGMITTHFERVQTEYLRGSDSLMIAQDWTREFISQLLHLTHGQWLYRNISRHHKVRGLLQDTERRSLLRAIDRFMQVAPEDLPEESKFLVEIDFQALRQSDTVKQSYWVHAIKAAVWAGRRRAKQRARRLRRRVDTEGHLAEPLLSHPPVPVYDYTPAAASLVGALVNRKRANGGSGSIADKSNKRRRPD
jgi:hypothetical protein